MYDRHHFIEEPCDGKLSIGAPKRHGFEDRRGRSRPRRVKSLETTDPRTERSLLPTPNPTQYAKNIR
jgi:hypothetical protein